MSCIDPTTRARHGGRWRRPKRRPHRRLHRDEERHSHQQPLRRKGAALLRRWPQSLQPAQGRGRGGWTGGNPPYWYGQIRVDPKNKEHVYLLSVGVTHTTDGGKTWSSPFGFGGDNHALWINPNDSDHMILGHDHGMGVTFDAGRTWLSPDNKPLAQFYAIGYDMEQPYNVYGGLQDNGSARGPSTMKGGGSIPFEAWYRVGGGDGFYNVVDPTDSRWLYNESQFGAIQRMDQTTGQSRSIRYTRPQGQDALRWNWSSPILISPHNPEVVYHGANVLLRSSNRGDDVDRDQPGPDEEPARPPQRVRQHPVRHPHHHRRVSGRRRRDLGRDRRWQRAGHA